MEFQIDSRFELGQPVVILPADPLNVVKAGLDRRKFFRDRDLTFRRTANLGIDQSNPPH